MTGRLTDENLAALLNDLEAEAERIGKLSVFMDAQLDALQKEVDELEKEGR